MMGDLPPCDRLRQVAGSLLRRLPEQMGELLAAGRFEDGRAALERLCEPSVLQQGAAAMAPEEAAWLAQELLQRWDWIAPVQLDPVAAIVGPQELWLADEPREVIYHIAVSEVEAGWSAQWSGAARPDPSGRRAVLTAHPPEGDTAAQAKMTVRVMARAQGRRCVLVAAKSVLLRRAVISMDDGRKRLVVSDQSGAPAGGVKVRIGEAQYTTQPNGLLELPGTLPAEALMRVEEAVVRVV